MVGVQHEGRSATQNRFGNSLTLLLELFEADDGSTKELTPIGQGQSPRLGLLLQLQSSVLDSWMQARASKHHAS